MRFIGDVHGRYKQYRRLIKAVPQSIQVGDLGLGFRYIGQSALRHGAPLANPPYDAMVRRHSSENQSEPGDRTAHRFIRGNHDNPSVCRNHTQWIEDGTWFSEWRMMLVGGALSIDKHWRTPGYNWWPDEELDYGELSAIAERYAALRPRIMVTHDAPETVATLLIRREKLEFPSRTRQALQSMWETHQPQTWIFGHWHQSWTATLNGTRFICLNELEALDMDLEHEHQ